MFGVASSMGRPWCVMKRATGRKAAVNKSGMRGIIGNWPTLWAIDKIVKAIFRMRNFALSVHMRELGNNVVLNIEKKELAASKSISTVASSEGPK